MTQHQVSDELLMSYAAGSLAEGWSLAVATHLALCPESRRRAEAATAIGGALLDQIEPAALAGGSLAAVRRRLAATQADVGRTGPAPSAVRAPVLPEPLRSYVGGDADTLRWRRLGLGAYQLPIATRDGRTSVRLLRIAGGEQVPEHGHRGMELTVVLAGSLVDGDEIFRRGDIEEANESVEHQPRAGAGEDCICLAVTDAPLRFSSFIVRMVQPFLRI